MTKKEKLEQEIKKLNPNPLSKHSFCEPPLQQQPRAFYLQLNK